MHTHGYDVQWQLISSAHYIAHKRERVYIVATKRKEKIKQIFPIHINIKKLKYGKDTFNDMLDDSSFNFMKKQI